MAKTGSCSVSVNLKAQFKVIMKDLQRSRDDLQSAVSKSANNAKLKKMNEKLENTLKIVQPLITAAETMKKTGKK